MGTTLKHSRAVAALTTALTIGAWSSGMLSVTTANAQTGGTEIVTETFSTGNLVVQRLLSELRDSTVVVSNGTAMIALAQDLQDQLGLPGPEFFSLQPTSQTLGDLTVSITGLGASLDMSTLSADLVNSDIVVTVSGSGSAYAMVSYGPVSVSPTFHVPTLNISLTIGWDPRAEHFFLEPGGAVVTMPGASFSDCGSLGWCDALAGSFLPDIESALSDRLAAALGGLLGSLDVRAAFEKFALATCSLAAPPPPPQGAYPWSLLYSNQAVGLTIASGSVVCRLTRTDNPAPRILGVVPSTGGPGDTVTIHAQNLEVPTTGATIAFGDIPVQDPLCNQGPNNSDCIVTVPMGGSGTVDVRVTRPSGLRTAIEQPADQFTYQGLSVTSIDPAQGATSGGTFVRIDGMGFDVNANADGSMNVFFGGIQTSGMYCQSSTTCFTTSPPNANVGPVDVTVALDGHSSPTSAVFTYTALPQLVGLSWTRSAGATVSLDSDAPAGGVTVSLSSSDPSFMVAPATVTVPAGASQTTFGISFAPGAQQGSATLTASYAGTTMSVPVDLVCSPPIYGCPPNRSWDDGLCRCVLQPKY